MEMSSFLSLQNFVLSCFSLVGVVMLFDVSMKIKILVQTPYQSTASGGQLFVMLMIAVALISLSTYIDMSTATMFGHESYGVLDTDPWIQNNSIQGFINGIGMQDEDLTAISSIVVTLFMVIKVVGIGLIGYAIVNAYKYVDGAGSTMSGAFIVWLFIVGAAFFNIGEIITITMNTFGYSPGI